MNRTKIETIKNPDGTQGYSWNPISGCKYHTPEGLCLGGMFPCYAYRLAHGRLKDRYLSNKNVIPNPIDPMYAAHELRDVLTLSDPFYPRFWPERLKELDHDFASPRGIFVCDMSDLFGIGIPEQWTKQVMDAIRFCPQHRFYLLTKQPQNLPQWSPFPDNCWVGVTITNDKMRYDALYWLKQIHARVKYLSIEPHLGRIQIAPIELQVAGIGWIIEGEQTRPTLHPRIEWVTEIVEAADKAGVPVFLKDNLWDLLYTDAWDNDIFWANEKATLRQEQP